MTQHKNGTTLNFLAHTSFIQGNGKSVTSRIVAQSHLEFPRVVLETLLFRPIRGMLALPYIQSSEP